MRAQLALALLLTCGVAMAGGTVIQVSGAPALPLTGGTVTGQIVTTQNPASTAAADSSVLVNPAACASNELLLTTAVAGSSRMSTDCEGDMLVAGTLGVTGATTPQISATHATYAANYTTATGATGLSEILSYNTNNSAYLGLSVFGSSYAAAGNDWGSSTAPGSAQVLLRPGDAAGDGIIGLAVDGRNLVFGTTVAGTRYNRAQISSAGTISLGTSTPSTFSSTGAATMSSTLDVKGAISNTGASNSGRVYVSDDSEVTGTQYLTNGTAALRIEGTTNSYAYFKIPNSAGYEQITFLDQAGATKSGEGFGGTATTAPYLGNAYSEIQSGVAHRNLIAGAEVWSWDTNGLINSRTDKFAGDLMLNDIVRLPSATYATTDCDAAAEVGRQVMHKDGANHISGCLCEQTGAATYAFKAMSATGVCP